MSELSLYQNLEAIHQLTEISDDTHFIQCPLDWMVVISDVRGSTQAVADGRYREVNVCGAAMIALIQEKIHSRNFPFVFGGDGATVLLPVPIFNELKGEFRNLIFKIKRDFKLDLRVGSVSYQELLDKNAPVFMARMKISESNSLATLKGPGLALAERLIKSDDKYLLSLHGDEGEASLSKLSCRFKPIQTKKDHILSVLVVPNTAKDFSLFMKFLENFKVYLLDTKFRPINRDLDMDSLWSTFVKERKIDRKHLAIIIFLKILALKILAKLAQVFDNSVIAKAIGSYYNDIPSNSDYQKFDGALRVVVDCSSRERDEMIEILETYRKQGIIFYGTSQSKTAVMTCIVDDINGGEHLHFIDGGDGGYTLAAKAMKLMVSVAESQS